MHEDVDDVIAMRSAAPDGLRPMLTASFALHVAVMIALFVLPRDWFSTGHQENVIRISLGGTFGDRTSGTTAIGGKQVDQVAPPPKRPELAKPPEPAKTDTMKVPATTAKPEPVKPAPAQQTPTRTPTTGQQISKGTSAVDTGAVAPSQGLTFGGGAGGGGSLEIADFCCPEFLEAMAREIRRNWNQHQQEEGTTIMRFIILRDGSIADISVFKSSGKPLLDLASRSAIPAKLRIGLPAQFAEDRLVVRLAFEYRR
jgi:outer membrane biosynthesis protein TonB